MEHRFENHGLTFAVDGDGFMSARADFDAICANIESALNAMPPAEVTRLHAAAVADGNDPSDSPEAMALNDIGIKHKAEGTRGWHNPNAAHVSLIACERRPIGSRRKS